MKELIMLMILIPQINAQTAIQLPKDFVIQKDLLLTRASVNNSNGYFIIDCGAPSLILNNRIFEIVTEYKTGQSITGKCPFATTTAKNFKWQNITSKKSEVITLDLTHFEKLLEKEIIGLIGMEILKKHALLVNYQQNEVKLLTKGGYLLTDQPDLTLPIIMNGDLACIYVQLKGENLLFGLDTGSRINVLQEGTLPLEIDQPLDTIRLKGLNQQIKYVSSRKESDLFLEGFFIPQSMDYLMLDLSNHYCPTPIQGILGGPFFQQAKMILDFNQQQLHIWIDDNKTENNHFHR